MAMQLMETMIAIHVPRRGHLKILERLLISSSCHAVT